MVLLRNLILLMILESSIGKVPIVVNTWFFAEANQKAWNVLKAGENDTKDVALDAITVGCKACQDEQCDFTVGFGGSPDESGETTLDAMIFDGNTFDMGAVGGIRRIKNAIGVARHVLENTEHSILVGSLATEFAEELGFPDETLQTNYSQNMWSEWKRSSCQPNFWKNVNPDPKKFCGPYKSKQTNFDNARVHIQNKYSARNHDTIGMIVIGSNGHVVAGTSSNGAKYKIPGRVGDAPLPGAGAYADSSVGAAVATGDGDIMMRFLPSFFAVEQLRREVSPEKASKAAIDRISEKYPSFFGAVIAIDKNGNVGTACNGMESFPYVVTDDNLGKPRVYINTKCSNFKKS